MRVQSLANILIYISETVPSGKLMKRAVSKKPDV